MDDMTQSRAPWSRIPSLKDMTNEAGMDFDHFIKALKEDRTDVEMAEEFGVSEKMISHLREHFYSYGLGSIEGQD